MGAMRNNITENMEHSLDVAIIAHALAVINNVYFGGDWNADGLPSWPCITMQRDHHRRYTRSSATTGYTKRL